MKCFNEITIESSRITERDQDELGSSFEAGTIPSDQITERRLSTEQVVVESSATSEPQKDEEQYEQNYESGHNAPEYRTTAEVTKTESTTQEDEESFEESVTPEQEFVESNDEQDDYYDSRETSAGDTNMIEPSATVTEYGHQSPSEKEKDDELQAAHEFETLRKSSGAEIQLESPHESEHEKEDQHHPESVVSSDAIKIEHTETVQHEQYEPMLLSQQQQCIGFTVIDSQYDRKDEERADEIHIVREEIQQNLFPTEIQLESPHESEQEHEDQYHLESVVSSDAIKFEHTETFQEDHYEPMLVSQQQQQIGSPVLESQYEREDEERVGETHIVHEEIHRTLIATEIEVESPHESDREEDEEVQYQLEENLSSDQITNASRHITERDQHELGSSFEAGTIPSHLITDRRPITEQGVVESLATSEPQKDEPQYEENYESDQHALEYRTTAEVTETEFTTQDDEKPFEESVTPQQEFVESPVQATPSTDEQADYYHSRETSAGETSIIESSEKAEEYGHQLSFENEETDELHVAHEFEILQKSSPAEILLESPHETDHEKEDQYDPESLVSSDAIKIEHTETVEHEQYEPMLLSQQQQQLGSPVLEGQYEREEVERAGETHIVHEEIQQNLSSIEIELESTHESDQEEDKEKEAYQPEQRLKSDEITIESPHITEQDLHELGSSFEAGTIPSHQIAERRLNTEQVVVESSATSEPQKDEEQYEENYESGQHAPEYRTTAEVTKTESTTQEDEESFEESVTPERKLLESPLGDTTPTDEQDDYYDSRETSAGDTNIMEPSATVEEYAYRSSFEKEEVDELQAAHEFEIKEKSKSTTQEDEKPFEESVTPERKFLESPLGETTHSDEQSDYYDSRETSAGDTNMIEPSATVTEYGHQSPSEKEEDDELQPAHEFETLRKSSGTEIQLESPHETDHEEEDQQHPESVVSSDAIKIEPTETVEHHRYEPFIVSQQQQNIGSPVIESQYDRKDEEPAGEIHIAQEEIQQNLSSIEIELESTHESDHGEDEEVQYQPDQKLSSDPIAIESPHTAEDDEYELSSSFEVGTIPSHQITERRPNTDQVVVESLATSEPQPDEQQYEQNYESDQHAPEYRTAGEVTKTESTTQEDEKPFEESVTPERKFLESPLGETTHSDEQ
ncbi:unnamed protein product, partial [Rotaria magnacalcarata]